MTATAALASPARNRLVASVLRRSSTERIAARAIVAFVLTGCILPLLVGAQAGVSWSPALALCVVVTLHSAIGLSVTLADTVLRPLHVGFWAYAYCFFGLAGIAQAGSGIYPTGVTYAPHIATLSVTMVELGLVAFSAGSFAGRRWAINRARTRRSWRPPLVLSQTRVVVLSILLLLVAAVIVWKILPARGGIHVLFTSRQATHQTVNQNGDSADSTIALETWGVSVPALWALLGLLQRRSGVPGRRWWSRPWLAWALLIAVLVVNIGINNPISRPRFWAGTVILALIFSAPKLRRSTAFRVGVAAFLVIFIVVFPYADYFRYTDRSQVQTTSIANQFQQKLDYDSLSQLQVGIDYVDHTGFHPDSALGSLLFFVPRADWPNKPEDTGIVLSNWVGYSLTNRSAPLWIEAYICGGYGAVAVVMFVLGIAWSRIDDAFDRARRKRPDALILTLVPTLAFFQIIVLRGSLLQATAPLALLLIVPRLISTRQRSSGRQS